MVIKHLELNDKTMIEFEEFIEEGSNLEHDRWARWQQYFFSKCGISISSMTENVNLTLPRVLFERWKRQIETKYSELSELEKESDRKETRNYLPLIKKHFLPKSVVKEKIEKYLKIKCICHGGGFSKRGNYYICCEECKKSVYCNDNILLLSILKDLDL